MFHRAETKVRNAAVATNGSDAPLVQTLEADEAISVTSGTDRGTVGEQLSETEARQIFAVLEMVALPT